jgi:hypothetical protein
MVAHHMKAEFIFEPGDVVKSKKNGLIAPITHCAVSAGGNVYLQRGIYAEQWAAEDELEQSEIPQPELTPTPAPKKTKKVK